jgi:carbon storage regulator
MLVLTRKKSEMIHIGDHIVIKVISTGRGKVKIGIEAPGEVRVMRAEMLTRQQPASESKKPLENESSTALSRVNRVRQAMAR